MTLEYAVPISLSLLAALAVATWYLAPKPSEVFQARNLALSKCLKEEIDIELNFHERLNNVYTPPSMGVGFDSQADIYGGLRELANHYVEQRDKVLRTRDRLRFVDRWINRVRQLQIGNCISYVLLMIVVLLLHMKDLSTWWLYLIIWGLPWPLLFWLNWKKDKLLHNFDI